MTFSLRLALVALTASALAPAAALAGPPQATFMDNCSACHQATGKGIKGAFPALAGSALVQGDPAILTATVLNGRAGMPAFKDDLTDIELAGVLTYIRTSWGNKGKPVSIADVKNVRKSPPKARGLQAH
jgi:mono/diheme cytochrome c family protein